MRSEGMALPGNGRPVRGSRTVMDAGEVALPHLPRWHDVDDSAQAFVVMAAS
jgi:hypothetical protein